MQASDITNPNYYKDFLLGTDVIEIIETILTEEEFIGFCKGNALKYRCRAGRKGAITDDIEKALWYEDRLGVL